MSEQPFLVCEIMRIINGKFKGRRFSPPTNITARPTTDFAKEGIFNVLANNYLDFEGKEVLDLFAGTGSISFEFVSRGCVSVTSIEMSERQLGFIHKTAATLKITNMQILRTDVFRYIKSCAKKYDVIFADPPYQLSELAEIPDLIFQYEMLKEDGILILEHGSQNSFTTHAHFAEHRVYGNVNFTIFR